MLTACGGGSDNKSGDSTSGGETTGGGDTSGGDTTGSGSSTNNGGSSSTNNTTFKSGTITIFDDLSAWDASGGRLSLSNAEELFVASGSDERFVIADGQYGVKLDEMYRLDVVDDSGARAMSFNKKDNKLYYIDSEGNLYKVGVSLNTNKKYSLAVPELVDLSTSFPSLDNRGQPLFYNNDELTQNIQDIAIDKNGNFFFLLVTIF